MNPEEAVILVYTLRVGMYGRVVGLIGLVGRRRSRLGVCFVLGVRDDRLDDEPKERTGGHPPETPCTTPVVTSGHDA